MNASYHQKQDLLRFGQQVQRLLVQRLITARNSGRLTPEQLAVLEELVPTAADVQTLLDGFETSIDVSSALAELEPMLPRMRMLYRSMQDIGARGTSIAMHSMIERLDNAIKYLKAEAR